MKKVLLSVVAAMSLATTTMAQTVPNYVPTNGLVGWWPFNGNANDESGNGNNGTVNGATLTTDRFGNAGKAYSFNGSNQNITKNNFSINSGAISLSFWLNANIINNTMRIITHNWDNSQSSFSTHLDQQSLIYGYIGAVTKDVNNNMYHVWNQNIINSNEWCFVTFIASGTSNKIYINSTLINSITTPNLKSAINTLFFGGDNSYPFNGKLDDIGIWNRALSQQEITNLYNANICYNHITVTDTLIINTNMIGFSPVTYQNTIKVWPNPAHDHITIDNGNIANLSGYQIKISNVLGQQVFQSAINQQQFYINLSTWTGNGTYYINLINPQGVTVETRVIVVQ